MVLGPSAKPADFVREIPKRTIKTLDLVDVVAGGDGFSGRRNRGIDPTTGQTVDDRQSAKILVGDGKYHRVEGLPFVDGVFIPDGRRGPGADSIPPDIRLTRSAGVNETWHHIWAGGVSPSTISRDERFRGVGRCRLQFDWSRPAVHARYSYAGSGPGSKAKSAVAISINAESGRRATRNTLAGPLDKWFCR